MLVIRIAKVQAIGNGRRLAPEQAMFLAASQTTMAPPFSDQRGWRTITVHRQTESFGGCGVNPYDHGTILFIGRSID